jgi:predicted metal-binding protein
LTRVADQRACLFVCTTCKQDGAPLVEGETPPGRLLYEAVAGALNGLGPDAPVDVQPIVCFANCEQGCSAGLSAPGKWSYMVGHLGPGHADDLVAYASAYAKSDTGFVSRSGRPESLRHAIVGRFPTHLAFPQSDIKDAAE